MTRIEILQCVVACHNRIVQMLVSGDNAILVGDTIRDMRQLAQQLQHDIEHAENKKQESAKKERGE